MTKVWALPNDGIPNSLRSLVDPNVSSYDPGTGDIYYRSGNMGYAVKDFRDMHIGEQVYALEKMDREAKRKEVDFARLQQSHAKDIRNMSMSEYNQLRKELGYNNSYGNGLFGSGVSLNTGLGYAAPTTVKQVTKFDHWKDAREKFINGEIIDIEEVLKYVESDEDGYSKLVDMEIAEERAKNVTVHQHRINWRRWPLWRWLGAWLHRRDLGRNRHGQDYVGPTLYQRSRAAHRGPLDYGGF
jgi:hypothetical protein